MKTNPLSFLMFLFFLFTINLQAQTCDCSDEDSGLSSQLVSSDCFESYSVNTRLPQSGSWTVPNFDKPTLAGTVVSTPVYSGSKSLKLQGSSNSYEAEFYTLNGWRSSLEILVPTGKEGMILLYDINGQFLYYFNFYSDRTCYVFNKDQQPIGTFSYNQNTWQRFSILGQAQQWRIFLENNNVFTVNNPSNIRASYLSIAAFNSSALMYIDKLCHLSSTTTSIICSQNIDPVCLNGSNIQIGDNGCRANSSGYITKEFHACNSVTTTCDGCFGCFRYWKGSGDNDVCFDVYDCDEGVLKLNEGSFRSTTTYEWSFDDNVIYLDGTNAASKYPKCRFSRPGTYKGCVKIKTSSGITECCKIIEIKPCEKSPVPLVTYTYNQSTNEVQFDASSTENANGYEWDFGGGTISLISDTKPKCRFAPGRCYTVCLYVYNGCGSSQICITVCPSNNCNNSPLPPRHPRPRFDIENDEMAVSGINFVDFDKVNWILPTGVSFINGTSSSSFSPVCKLPGTGRYLICAVFYWGCHKICICWVIHHPGASNRCTNVETLECGKIYNGTTINAKNNFTRSDLAECLSSSNPFNAGDKLYQVTGGSGNVVIWDFNADLDLFLLNSCGSILRCLDKSTTNDRPYEYIDLSKVSPDKYYLLVDGYNSAQESKFKISFTCNNLCPSPDPISCDQLITGNTGKSNINLHSKYSCDPEYNFTGPENFYSFKAPKYGEYTIDLTGFSQNLDLFVVDFSTDCRQGLNCKKKSTNPSGPEQIKITLNQDEIIFISVDGALGVSGVYNLKVTCPTTTVIDCSTICPYFARGYGDCQNFENFNLGPIATQNTNDPWALDNITVTDPSVVNSISNTGTKSLNIKTTALSVDYFIQRPVNNITRLEWMMYVPSGTIANWDIKTTDPNTLYAYNVIYNADGTGNSQSLMQTGNINTAFKYPANKWFRNAIIINPIEKYYELWINSIFINKIPFQKNGSNQTEFSFLRLKGTANNGISNYFIDDLCYAEIAALITCDQSNAPVCVNGKQFFNECYARAAGYSEYEFTKGACTTQSTPKLTFDIDDNICDQKGKSISIPVRVKNFTNIRGLQLSVTTGDESVFEITGLTKGNLPEIFVQPNPARKTYSLVALYDNGITLPDGSVAFNIIGNLIGNPTQSTKLSIINIPSAQIKASNGDNKDVPVEVIDGSTCVNSISNIKLEGKVLDRNTMGIKNAIVSISGGATTNATTTGTGQYSFSDLNPGGNYTIKVSRPDFLLQDLDIFDLIILRDHILNKAPVTDPMQWIAGDVNKDGDISILDFGEIKDILLARTANYINNTPWVFVPTDELLTLEKAKAQTFKTSRSLNAPSTSKSDLDFIGIRIGDLNGSANPQDLSQAESKIISGLEPRNAGNMTISIPTIKATKNQLIYLPIVLDKFNTVRAFQFNLKWDASKLEYQNIIDFNGNLPGFGSSGFAYNPNTPGVLNCLWLGDNNVSLGDHSKLATVVLKVKSNTIGDIITLGFNNLKASEVGASITAAFTDGKVTVSDVSTKSYDFAKTDLDIRIFPNPSNGSLFINHTKPIKVLALFDMAGKLYDIPMKANENQYQLDLTGIAPGVYLLKVSSEGIITNHKIIIQ